VFFTTSARFDRVAVNEVLRKLRTSCERFAAGPGAGSLATKIDFAVEARYPHQIWDIEVPLRHDQFETEADLSTLIEDFHETHRQIFEVSDPGSGIELVTWRANARCKLQQSAVRRLVTGPAPSATLATRPVYFAKSGWVEATIARFEALEANSSVEGPAIVESSFTTIVVDPSAVATRTASGGLQIRL
jgi:N-methylhydantoinase A